MLARPRSAIRRDYIILFDLAASGVPPLSGSAIRRDYIILFGLAANWHFFYPSF